MNVITTTPLADQVAVVTGGARGIGRAIALELAAAGADVFVHTGKSHTSAEAVATQIESLGRRAKTMTLDLTEPHAFENLVDAAWQWQDRVDVWVNNAGADVLTGPAATWSFADKLAQLWRVDVEGTIELTRRIGARMRSRGRGVIVNQGWDQAAHGMAGDSGELFATVKGAIMAFSRSAALSLAPEVRVNCLAPGWIQTAWGANASEDWQQRARRECQLGRWGTPDDVARAALFLATDNSSFLTGQTLAVNGGFRPR